MSFAPHISAVMMTLTLLGCVANGQALPLASTALQPRGPNTLPLLAKTSAPAASHRAHIIWANGQMTIEADNASLNQTLREISRITAMKITGGVAEERIFGVFGPAAPAIVLAMLLEGTGNNVLLLEDPRHEVRELVLTPRMGGASPPNPNAARDANEDSDASDLPPQAMPPTSRQPRFPVLSPPENAAPVPVEQQPNAALPANSALQPPPPGTTTEESPNGIKTPQQIYDQLMKIRQQQNGRPQ